MAFESFVPAKKRSIGFAVLPEPKKQAPKGFDFNNFLAGLDKDRVKLAVSSSNNTDSPVKKALKLTKQKQRKVGRRNLEDVNFSCQHSILKQVNIEASFDLRSLIYSYKDHGHKGLGNTCAWIYPEPSVRQYQFESSFHQARNIISHNVFWTLNDNKNNPNGYEKHTSFVKSVCMKWQEAFNSISSMFFTKSRDKSEPDSLLSEFYLLGEAISTHIPVDKNSVFVSAVFLHTPPANNSNTAVVDGDGVNCGPFSCVLIGVNKTLRKRLFELGTQPCVITELGDNKVNEIGISTSGLYAKSRTGENVFITGEIQTRLAMQCLCEEILHNVMKSEDISRLPVLRAGIQFDHAVPYSPQRIADDCTFEFSSTNTEKHVSAGVGNASNTATTGVVPSFSGAALEPTPRPSEESADQGSDGGTHRMHLQGHITYDTVSSLVRTLINLAKSSTQKTAPDATAPYSLYLQKPPAGAVPTKLALDSTVESSNSGQNSSSSNNSSSSSSSGSGANKITTAAVRPATINPMELGIVKALNPFAVQAATTNSGDRQSSSAVSVPADGGRSKLDASERAHSSDSGGDVGDGGQSDKLYFVIKCIPSIPRVHIFNCTAKYGTNTDIGVTLSTEEGSTAGPKSKGSNANSKAEKAASEPTQLIGSVDVLEEIYWSADMITDHDNSSNSNNSSNSLFRESIPTGAGSISKPSVVVRMDSETQLPSQIAQSITAKRTASLKRMHTHINSTNSDIVENASTGSPTGMQHSKEVVEVTYQSQPVRKLVAVSSEDTLSRHSMASRLNSGEVYLEALNAEKDQREVRTRPM